MIEALKLELRRSRSLISWIAVAAVGYGGIMAGFWPIMRDNSALFAQYMNIFPKEFLAAFGMEGSLGDPGVFFTTYVGSWLWPILAALAGIIMATRPVAVDLERGFLDLPLATGLSRTRYLVAAICAQAVALAALAFVTVLGFWVASQLVAAPYELGRMLVVGLLAWVFACAIAACATLLSVVTLSRAIGGGIVAAVLLGMYLMNVVALMQPDLTWLQTITAFHYFKPTPLIDNGTLPLAELLLFSVVALVAWGLAVWSFRQRDLSA